MALRSAGTASSDSPNIHSIFRRASRRSQVEEDRLLLRWVSTGCSLLFSPALLIRSSAFSDTPKKEPTVGRRCDLPWVVSTTYSRFFRRPTVDRFLPLPRARSERGGIAPSRSVESSVVFPSREGRRFGGGKKTPLEAQSLGPSSGVSILSTVDRLGVRCWYTLFSYICPRLLWGSTSLDVHFN